MPAGTRNSSVIGTLLLAAGSAVAGGCASSGTARLTEDEFDRMPREARQAVYDAENDVVIARSRQDEAALKLAALQKEIDEIDERWSRTEARLNKAGAGSRVSLAKKVLNAHTAFLENEVTIGEAAIETSAAGNAAAQARLEEILQRQLIRLGRVPSTSLKPMEDTVEKTEKAAREAQAHELDLRAQAQKPYQAWKAAEDEYARTTGDFDSGIWID